jgi:hypothetical protein
MSKISRDFQQNPVTLKLALSKSIFNGTTLAFLFYLVLTSIFLRPVVFHFFDQVSGAGDTYEYVWRLWWFKHTLIDTGQSPWLVPFIYYPFGYPLAYSELTPTNTIFGLPFTIAFGEYSAHNALLFLSFFLTAFNTFLLARQLTGNGWAGLLAGALFAFTPFRRGQYFHLIHLTIQWFPLIFLFLERFLQTGRQRFAVAGGVAFGLNALASWYLALAGALLSLVWLAARAWPWSTYLKQRHLWLGLALFTTTGVALIMPFLPPFLAVSSDPDTRPTLENTNFWSASPTDYLIPNPFHPLWGSFIEEKVLPLAALADKESPTQTDFEAGKFFPQSNLNIATEFLMSPGLIALLFALYGLRWTPTQQTRPWLYLTGVAIVLSLGLTLHLAGRQVVIPAPPAITVAFNQAMNYISMNLSLQREPFTIGQDTGILIPMPSLLVRWFVPGVGNTRTWTRFGQFAIFGLTILAAYGAAAWHAQRSKIVDSRWKIEDGRSKYKQRSSTIHNTLIPRGYPFGTGTRPQSTIYYLLSTIRNPPSTAAWLIVLGLALFEVWWKPMPTHPPVTGRPVDVWLRQQPSHNVVTPSLWPGEYCNNLTARRQPDGDAIIQYPLDSGFNGSQFIYTRTHCKPIVHAYGNPFGFMLGRRHPELLTFPDAASLALLSRWQVRYVLIETAGPGTSTSKELLEQVARAPCLRPATVQGSVHVFELVNCLN